MFCCFSSLNFSRYDLVISEVIYERLIKIELLLIDTYDESILGSIESFLFSFDDFLELFYDDLSLYVAFILILLFWMYSNRLLY